MRPSSRLRTVIDKTSALSAVVLAGWLAFHLWEHWSAFAGREAWAARVGSTSRGVIATAVELLVIVILAAGGGATVVALVTRTPVPGRAREGDAGLVRALGRLAPFASITTLAFVTVHVGQLWAPKLAGAGPSEQWVLLIHTLARPEVLVLHAAGLSAVALHLAVALPAALESLGLVKSDAARRSAMLVATVFALCAWALAAQLVGWLGTGAGTFWAI